MKWKKNRYLYLTLIFAFTLFYSCEKVGLEPVKVGTVSFSKDIQPIFSGKCIGCHNGSIQNPDLRSGKAYNSLKNGQFYNTSTPSESVIYKQLTTNPSHTSKASELEVQKILQWIVQGANND